VLEGQEVAGESFKVQKMPRGALLEDGAVFEIELRDDADQEIKLHFSSAMLETFLARAGDLIARAQAQQLKDSGRMQVRAREAEAASAAAPKGAGKVLLSIRPRGAAAQYFALDAELVANLRPQLRKAEEAARRGPGST
jgi:hypothetical protein